MFSEKHFINKYESPLGKILLAADEEGLIGLWFEGQKYFAKNLSIEHEEKNLKIFDDTKKWLDIYFSSCEPKFLPQFHLNCGADTPTSIGRRGSTAKTPP